ncbi:MAG: acyl-CoA dehydrogenase family protein [Firmicutes bacterium]|nr:acyl-CoA dehydrogenase family protein [Bacillota bacterium]
MIDFTLTPQQKQLREMAHAFAQGVMRPYAMEADRIEDAPKAYLQQAMALGVGLDLGGAPGQSGAERADDRPQERTANRNGVLLAEEIGWGDPGLALALPGPGLGGPPVALMGTPAQKEKYLGMFRGAKEPMWGAYALTEPEAGSDVSGIRTSAKKVEGGWILNGRKIFITNGGRAAWNVVFATVDPTLGRAGQRAFLVEKGTPGFTCTRILHKMGLRASETAELLFEDCFVPDENLLGGEAQYQARSNGPAGFRVAMQTFDNTRPVVAAMAMGIARAAYEYTLEILRQGYAPTGHFYHSARERLAEMYRKIEAARSLVWEAAWKGDIGEPNSKEASMSKAYAGRVSLEVCAMGLELLGPTGVVDHPVEKLYRDCKVFDIFEGTNQVQHLVVARRLYAAHGIRV